MDYLKVMNSNEFEYAREQAANEFFIKELNITDIKIMESKLSFNKDNSILWVKVGDNACLRALNSIAKIIKGRKLEIKLITKIPKEFWDQNKSLEINCAKEKKLIPS